MNGQELSYISVIQVLSSIVVAIATIALWRATKILAVETKLLRKFSHTPFVVGYFETSEIGLPAVFFVVKNTGNAPAFDVKLEINPPIPGLEPKSKYFKDFVNSHFYIFPPGKAVRVHSVKDAQVMKKIFRLDIEWRDRPDGNTKSKVSYKLKGKDIIDEGWVVKGRHHIAKELEKISKEFNKFNERIRK